MPLPPPGEVKPLSAYATPPQTRRDVSDALKSHYRGYVEWEGLEDWIATLPTHLQQVINIYYGEFRTIFSTAEVMGCAFSTVTHYLAEVKDMILECVGEGKL